MNSDLLPQIHANVLLASQRLPAHVAARPQACHPTTDRHVKAALLILMLSCRFIVGVSVFFTGMLINISSDYHLLSLRAPGDKSYKIPRGLHVLVHVSVKCFSFTD